MRIRCIAGPDKDRDWVLDKLRMVIGRDRDQCNVPLSDPLVSRAHAEISLQEGRFLFRDLGSTNGVLINNFKTVSQYLLPGDRLALGETLLIVLDDESAARIEFEETVPLIGATATFDKAVKWTEDAADPRAPRYPPHYADTTKVILQRSPFGRTDLARLAQSLNQIAVISRMSRSMQRITAADDLYALLESAVFEIFTGADRVCLLRGGEGDVVPVFMRSRGGTPSAPFSISRSILGQATRERIGILATDAAADSRFFAADSVVRAPVRSVMCAPLLNGKDLIGALYIDNRRLPLRFDENDLALFLSFSDQVACALHNAVVQTNIQKAYHESITALIGTIQALAPDTFGHNQRISRRAISVGQIMCLGPARLERLKLAAHLHDLNKIGADESLLAHSDSLSEPDRQTLRDQILQTERFLQSIEYLREIAPIIRAWRECYDGSGHPDGLRASAIPLEARILAAVDVFDTMTSSPGPAALHPSEALAGLRAASGTLFDPEVIEAIGKDLASGEESGA